MTISGRPLWIGLLCLGLRVAMPAFAEQSARLPIVLTDVTESVDLKKYLEVSREKPGDRSPADLERPERSGSFIAFTTAARFFESSSTRYWARFTLRNQSARSRWMFTLQTCPEADQYSHLFVPGPDGTYQPVSLSLRLPDRPAEESAYRSRFRVVPLIVAPGAEQTFYMKIYKEDGLRMGLRSPESLTRFLLQDQILNGLFYGFFLFLALYSGCIYLGLRDRSYLYHGILFLAVAGLLAYWDGTALGTFHPSRFPANPLVMFLLFGNFAFLVFFLFLRRFLDLRRRFPRLERIALVFIGLHLVAFPVFFLGIEQRLLALMAYMIFPSTTVYMVATLTAVRQRFRPAIYLLLGLTPFAAAIILSSLTNFAITVDDVPIAKLASLAMGLFFSFSLADRFVTIRQERELALLEKQRSERIRLAQTDFFVNLAHEIKTPLTLIANYLEAFARRHGTSPELDVVRRGVHKLSRDMVQFFDVLKMEKGMNSYLHEQRADLSTLLMDQATLFRPTAERHQVRLDVSVEPGLSLRADPSALERVVNNLLDNALKYNQPGGSVHVTLRTSDGHVLLRVADTGIGMEPAQIPRIFEPYTQLSNRKSNRQGIGMGLCLVKSIVDSLGGTIQVESRPAVGSTFTVNLPLGGEAGEPAPTECAPWPLAAPEASLTGAPATPPPTAAIHRPGRPTVLLVEDNPDLLALLSEEAGEHYNIITASNGRQALQRLQETGGCDLIVSDLMMDEMDGYGLLDELQRLEAWKEIPFLILTARASNEERLTALKRGAVDYVFKPFAVAELLARVDALLRLQELKRLAAEREHFASLGVLLAGIAHEMKNPLSGITGPLENLRKLISDSSLSGDPRVEKHLDYLNRSVDKLNRLIGTLSLILARRELSSERVNMASLITGVLAPFRVQEGERIRFGCSVDPAVVVQADPEAVTLILTNLVANGVDAIDSEGSLEIRVEQADEERRISVTDSGRGVAAEDLPHIFEPFFTTKSAAHGMGLGLFLVWTLCRQLRWNVRVDTREHAGTTFLLTLPDEPL